MGGGSGFTLTHALIPRDFQRFHTIFKAVELGKFPTSTSDDKSVLEDIPPEEDRQRAGLEICEDGHPTGTVKSLGEDGRQTGKIKTLGVT